MTTAIIDGQRKWSLKRDSDGHRTYRITHLVAADTTDGPANVLQTPGLPVPGNPWIVDGDVDIWAWCRPDADVQVHQEKEGDPATVYSVEQTFSTKPPTKDQGSRQRCADQAIEDPLLEPQKVSGSFVNFTEEVTRDRTGAGIFTSAKERMKGPQVEFEFSRPQIVIEQNVVNLQLATVAQMMNTVNDAPLWGVITRGIRLAGFTWSRQFHGTCFAYYTRTFTFEVYAKENAAGTAVISGWDRVLVDEGTKVLRGRWETNQNLATYGSYRVDPTITIETAGAADIIAYTDFHGNPTNVILDGQGRPWDESAATTGTSDDKMGTVAVEVYRESNFLLLGIPTTL